MNTRLSQMPVPRGDYEAQFNYEIGQRIAKKRSERGISQTEMGVRLGVHRNTVSRWEEGSPLSMWIYLRICDELSMPHTMMLPNHALHLGAALRELVREREGKRPIQKPVQAERDPGLTAEEKRIYGVK